MSPQPNHQEILSALPSKYIPNPTTSHYFHCCCSFPSHCYLTLELSLSLLLGRLQASTLVLPLYSLLNSAASLIMSLQWLPIHSKGKPKQWSTRSGSMTPLCPLLLLTPFCSSPSGLLVLLPQGLCTGHPLCLGSSFPR